MIYKYSQNKNYEDFSSGRVLYHKAGYPNFPVRLAAEIFMRSLDYSDKKNEINLYDPCCGCGYTATVLGFLFNEIIDTIYVSDISDEAVQLAQKNLSLLSDAGVEQRRTELQKYFNEFGKQSHADALQSLENLQQYRKHPVKINCFTADILESSSLSHCKFSADIIITDVPYGDLSSWSGDQKGQINILLDSLIPVIKSGSVISLSHNAEQKTGNNSFRKIEMFKTGRRVTEILKLK